jgi:hypothetical protein
MPTTEALRRQKEWKCKGKNETEVVGRQGHDLCFVKFVKQHTELLIFFDSLLFAQFEPFGFAGGKVVFRIARHDQRKDSSAARGGRRLCVGFRCDNFLNVGPAPLVLLLQPPRDAARFGVLGNIHGNSFDAFHILNLADYCLEYSLVSDLQAL